MSGRVPVAGEDAATDRAAREALRRYNRDRQRAIRAGTWVPMADPAVVGEHVRELRAMGMSTRSIAASAGVSLATVSALAWPEHSDARTRGVTQPVAAALLAVTGPDQAPPDGLVPLVGSRRRVQALERMGWTLRDIAAAAGLPHQSITYSADRTRTTRAKADAVAAAYDRLSMRQGPSTKARLAAERAGWPPPLAWDDDSIDDPAAVPHGLSPEPGDCSAQVDDAVVARVLAGTAHATTEQERAVIVPELAARGLSDHQIAALCRVSSRTVLRTRRGTQSPTRWRTAA